MYALGEYQERLPVYLGRILEDRVLQHGYTSGGAGYVISKPAVRMIVDEGSKFPADCPKDGGIEDNDLGRYC